MFPLFSWCFEIRELINNRDNLSVGRLLSEILVLKAFFFGSTGGNDYAGIHTKCTPHYMQLILEKQHYDKIDPSSLHLTDDSCKINFENSTVMIIRAPLGGCGTTVGKWGSFLDFKNKVFADITGRSSIAREPAYEFRLRCLYYTTAKLSLHSFKPETKIIVEPPTSKRKYNIASG